jgi:hypothetical protein
MRSLISATTHAKESRFENQWPRARDDVMCLLDLEKSADGG